MVRNTQSFYFANQVSLGTRHIYMAKPPIFPLLSYSLLHRLSIVRSCRGIVRDTCSLELSAPVMELANAFLLSHTMVEHATGVGLKLI